MKKITLTLKKQDADKTKKLLENKLFFTEEKKGLTQFTIYLKDEELDEFINKLDETIDFRFKENLLEVSTPDFVESAVLKRSEKTKEDAKEKTPVEKLLDSTRAYLKLDLSKMALTSIAGAIALIGLFMNNVAIIIGAMLLSPLLGPIYAFAINTAVGESKDAFKSIGNLLIMLLVVVILSSLFTEAITFFSSLSITSEIMSRMDANFIYIIMAILLGFASILALSKGISESIAGVAIAAAILPPAVVVGISLAMFPPAEVMKPFILTIDNLLGLMTGSLFATLILNIGPRKYYEKTVAKRFIKRTSILLTLLIVLLFIISIYL
ncbi:MAG: TIGR00341 family protein [Thermoplasmata archaeon]|nr:TIGR00341 family protein [Thermoplasmata archaeon]